jgi:formate dehydrogenase subunit gamma
MIRICAGVAAIVLVVLLGFTVAESFGGSAVVVPTNGVTDGGKRDAVPNGQLATETLGARADLQRWRADRGAQGAAGAPAFSGSSTPPQTAADNGDLAQLPLAWNGMRERDWNILREPRHLEGRASLPAERASVLVQPEGRTWRRTHNETVTFGGGWIIFGVSLLLALFLLLRGRIPLELGFSGRTVTRFNGLERANHWMTATSFILMALSGLVVLYGRFFVKPLIGAGAYNAVASVSLYLHIAFAAPFVLGVIVMIVLWLRQNLPTRLDLHWLARFGGFLSDDPVKPPARRFNAGQKLVFWGVALGGILLLASGLTLMFPFYWLGIQGIQTAMVVHSAIALLMIGLIIGHIYIGTIGMVGAFDAMGTGEVDRNWAEEHHVLWLAELEGRPVEALEAEMRTHRRRAPEPAE